MALWQAGESGNPAGRPTLPIGFQTFSERCKVIVGSYPAQDIIRIVADPKMFGKLSAFDGMIMRRLAEAFQADGNASMNSILDRMIGKPVQPIAQKVEHSIESGTLNGMKEVAKLGHDDMLAIRSILQSKLIDNVEVLEHASDTGSD